MSMNSRFYLSTFLALHIVMFIFSASNATELFRQQQNTSSQLTGGPISGAAKTSTDSTLVMGPWGSGADYNGQFQAPNGEIFTCQWNGWTSEDNTAVEVELWHASTYNAANLNGHGEGNIAAWCGSLEYESCGDDDPDGGYGNNVIEQLVWETEIADPSQPVQISIDAWLNFKVEPDYDFVHVGCFVGENRAKSEIALFTGVGENVQLQETFTYQPGDFVGDQSNLVSLYIQVTSDGAWSAEDCLYQNNGAVQIDDITVNVDDGAIIYFEDFENGDLGQWAPETIISVGDFANLRHNLADIDPCFSNNSCMVNFVDDGLVVPGTGGSNCISFCYGPGGYVVNSSGGLAGPDYHLNNSVVSPIMSWPENAPAGCILEFDIYLHEMLGNASAGIFSTWHFRSTASNNPADIENATWHSDDFILYGEGYRRAHHDVSHHIEPGAKFVQMRLGVYEVGYLWGWYGNDTSPAPYYDNVRVTAYEIGGPAMESREIDLANDGFPSNGTFDFVNPGNNSVRFDMARSIGDDPAFQVDPGDSVVIWAYPGREGATITEMPLMHYRVKPNTIFDPYRNSGLPLLGTITGTPARWPDGTVSTGRFFFDLPDTGFFFPGDVMHYYFTATDEIENLDPQTSILPADTLGFSQMDDALAYNQSFAFRALPSVLTLDEEDFTTPDILLWDDLGVDSSRPNWHLALDHALGSRGSVGVGYDVFYTNSPSSGLENGLGHKATAAQLDAYSVIFYASGNLSLPTLGQVLESSGNTPNLDVLDSWLRLGQKNMFIAGDNLASSLSFSSSQGQAFISDWLGVEVVSDIIFPYITGQKTPLVQTLPSNPVLFWADSWIAYGGCPNINSFDAVQAYNGGQRLAEFLAPDGSSGSYPYSAATLKVVPEFDSKIISLPYDLSFVWDNTNPAKDSADIPARAKIVRERLPEA